MYNEYSLNISNITDNLNINISDLKKMLEFNLIDARV